MDIRVRLLQFGEKPAVDNTKQFSNTITVPFCPESKLSGVNYTDFINQMWYQRPISIPSDWEGKRKSYTSGRSIVSRSLTDIM